MLDDYQAQLADAKAEAGRIIEEARQAADALKRDHEARPRPSWPSAGPGRGRHRVGQGPGHGRSADEVAELAIGAPRRSSSATSTATPRSS